MEATPEEGARVAEVASGLTQGRVEKLGGTQEDVAEVVRFGRKRAQGHSSKSSIYFGFHFSKALGPL